MSRQDFPCIKFWQIRFAESLSTFTSESLDKTCAKLVKKTRKSSHFFSKKIKYNFVLFIGRLQKLGIYKIYQ